MTTRLTQARQAVRPSLKARMMLSGPAGAGKTYSALEVATTLGKSVLLIDTERESALTYASEFVFDHLPWHEPFDPRELAKTIQEASATYDVIVIDSLSHFWTGPGGTLDIADGKFGGWKVARPAQVDLVQGILGAPAHVIVCVRSAMEHVQEKNEHGKQVVKKLGMSPKQDKELEYELNLSCEMDIEHRIAISKSRTTAVPVGRMFSPGHARDLARVYGDWLESGEAFADMETRAQIDTDRRAMTTAQKKTLWDLWQMHSLPDPQLLTETQAVTAADLIAQVVAGDYEPGDQPDAAKEESV